MPKITAYAGIQQLNAEENEEGDAVDLETGEQVTSPYVTAYVDTRFPGRADDLQTHTLYAYAEELKGFSASAAGYVIWREKLAKLVGWPAAPKPAYPEFAHSASAWGAGGGPFWELIHFTDCDGALGTAVCRKLAQDFTQFQVAADAHPEQRFRERYSDLRRAFDLAAQDGFVLFV